MKTPFVLETALATWRAEVAAISTARATDLAELESHLRDAFAALQANGLNDEEAFYLAQRRLGGGAELVSEFAKVHPDAIWAERGKWMLFGVLGFDLFWKGLHMLNSLLGIGITLLNTGRIGSILGYSLSALLTLGLFGWALRCLIRGKWRLGGLERFSALRHPAILAVFVGLLFIGEKAVEVVRLNLLINRSDSYGFGESIVTSTYLSYAVSFATLILLAVASALTHRRNRCPA